MNWILLALISPALWAFANLLDKILITKYIKNPFVLFLAFGLMHLVGLFFIPFVEFKFDFWPFVAAVVSGTLFLLGSLPYYKALTLDDVSKVVPIWASIPLMVLVLARIFLNEVLPKNYYLSFFLIVIGLFLISTENVKGVFRFSKALVLMLISCIIYSISEITTKYAVTNQDFLLAFVVMRISAAITALILILIYLKDIKKTKFEKGFLRLYILSGLSGAIAVFIFNYVLVNGYVTIISAISGFQSFFIFLFATIFSIWFPKILKEYISKGIVVQKIAAIVLLISGLVVLYI